MTSGKIYLFRKRLFSPSLLFNIFLLAKPLPSILSLSYSTPLDLADFAIFHFEMHVCIILALIASLDLFSSFRSALSLIPLYPFISSLLPTDSVQSRTRSDVLSFAFLIAIDRLSLSFV